MESETRRTSATGAAADHRHRAQAALADLLALLRAQGAEARMAPLLTLGEQLDRAITSFHLEAIRFRMFTLGRELHRADLGLPPEVLQLFDAIRVSLEAAGFHTRSVTS